MKKIILYRYSFLVLQLIYFGCSYIKEDNKNNNYENFNYVEFYSSGKIKGFGDTLNGNLEGLSKEFYETGELKYIRNYRNGNLNGRSLSFNQNGNPKSDLYYINGRQQGIQYNFFIDDSAKIKEKFILVHYPMHKEEPILINIKKFDKEGNLIEENGLIQYNIDNDTLVLGESFTAKLSISNSLYPITKLHIGNFDRGFNLKDSVDYKILKCDVEGCNLDIRANKVGKNNIRGYLENFKIVEESDSGYSTIGTINYLFDLDFYVKDSINKN